MKRLLHIGIAVIGLFILFAVTAYADVEINETHFPDPVFRQYIIDAGFDFNGDGILSSAEISEVRKIECERKDLRSLKGIEYFTELEELLCSNNQLTSLDVKKNTALTALECWNNVMHHFKTRPNGLLWIININTRINRHFFSLHSYL